jgi:acyl-coenzyme A synthetase/AMP-(fatty) acid ligase
VSLYKELAVGTVPPGQEGACFRTSGTTGSGRGVHRLWSADLYDHAALAWAQRCNPGAPADVIAWLSDPAEHQDSSLSHMVAAFPGRLGGHAHGRVTWLLRDGRPDVEGLRAALTDRPVYLATTAFALAEALEHALPALPAGSVVMVTGGFKGRAVAVSDADLYAACRAVLRPAHLVTEYGMTELSSQLWATPETPYAPPPWLRAVAVDPETGAAMPPGQPGLLRFFDLANLDASVGLETLDEGIVHADGTVTLLGRLPGAEARGCSLTVEEAWARDADR